LSVTKNISFLAPFALFNTFKFTILTKQAFPNPFIFKEEMTDPKQSKPPPKLNPFASEFIPGQVSFSSLFPSFHQLFKFNLFLTCSFSSI
jgi:hypothetical protein